MIIKEREIPLKLYGINRPLIGTNEYLIIGDVEQNNFNNFKIEQQSFNGENKQGLNETIIFISKIHDNFILASTGNGQIIQKTLGEKGEKTVISKFITNLRISCILMVDYESFLI